MKVVSAAVVLLLCVVTLESALAKLSPGDCEVCISVVDKIRTSLPNNAKKTKEVINQHIRSYCKTAKDKDNRFCYYIGGTIDAATGLLNSVSVPISQSIPSDRICERLKSEDLQICELRYTPKPSTPSSSSSTSTDTEQSTKKSSSSSPSEDLNKMKVRELKELLQSLGDECKGCTEKSEFVKKIRTLRRDL